MMEEEFVLKCARCCVNHAEMEITHIDTDGNLYCRKCSAYMKKVGGYDLLPFDVSQFLKKLPDNS
ncbi:MAG: hypothetical protein ACOWWO_16820 [Peptococcaceae bacterium]